MSQNTVDSIWRQCLFTRLDYWTHPNCRKMPHSVQDIS